MLKIFINEMQMELMKNIYIMTFCYHAQNGNSNISNFNV